MQPDGPIVPTRHYIDTLRIQRGSHHALAVTEAILAAEAEVQRHRQAAMILDKTPEAPLAARPQLAGMPCRKAVRPLDLAPHQPIPQIGGEQTQAVDLVRVALR